MNIFSIGPFEQFDVPRNPDDPYVPIDPPDDDGNPFEWVYDHTQRDKQGDPIKIGPWNDRLTDIVNWIPGALRDTELTEFVSLYQDFLNKGMYTTPCKWDESELATSMLKKIERILDFRDPSEIDENLIQNYADLLGFSASDMKKISEMNKGEEGDESLDDVYNRCRELIRSIPFLEANKTTEIAMMLLIGILGKTFEFKVMYLGKGRTGQDYDNCYWEDKGNPTPHFGLELPLGKSLDDATAKVVNQIIESIRPINTVYEGITQSETIDVTLGSNTKDEEGWKNADTMKISSTIYNNQFMDVTEGTIYVNPNPQVSNRNSTEEPILTKAANRKVEKLDTDMLLDKEEE